jgi:hypothetical protein
LESHRAAESEETTTFRSDVSIKQNVTKYGRVSIRISRAGDKHGTGREIL